MFGFDYMQQKANDTEAYGDAPDLGAQLSIILNKKPVPASQPARGGNEMSWVCSAAG